MLKNVWHVSKNCNKRKSYFEKRKYHTACNEACSAVRSNAAEFNPKTAKILSTVQNYFHNELYDKVFNRKTSGKTYCVYTEYESDHMGEYTYLIGKEVELITEV